MPKNQSASRVEQPHRLYVKEYLYCVLLFSMLGVLLAIASFDPRDATIFVTVSNPGNMAATNSNLFGPLGASVADWSLQLMGIGAPLFALIFIVQILMTYRQPAPKSRLILRVFGFPQLVICYLGFLNAVLPSWKFQNVEFFTGGLLGHVVASFFQSALGIKGSAIALLFGVIASLPLCLGVRPLAVVVKLLGWAPFSRAKELAEQVSSHETEEMPHSSAFDAPENSALSSAQKPEKNPALHPTATPVSNPSISAFTVPQSPRTELRTAQEIPATENHAPVGRADTTSKSQTRAQEGEALAWSADEFSEFVKLLEFHPTAGRDRESESEKIRLKMEAVQLEEKLGTFGVTGTVVRSQPGPVVNVHEFEPSPGIKVSKVLGLQDDLALGLKAQSVLMGPQAGKSTIGIEIPAQIREVVSLRELLEAPAFQNSRAQLPMALGKLVDGEPLIGDLASMPHLLVAGATGAGKSVGINVMLLSLMMKHTPRQVRMILVDPKMLELSTYDGIGHLLMPVVTEPQKAAGALRWAIDEMERRYRLMKEFQVRNIYSYNMAAEAKKAEGISAGEKAPEHLPYIVVVIDELCDLMMTAPKDVEDCIQRLAQKARAAGIHLILATQRPSVDVLTGVIKANLPCRLSFQVASKHDSRTIIENIGAEKLLGKGDMLFLPPGTSRLVRAHCAYVGDKEIASVANKLREIFPAEYDSGIMHEVDKASAELSQKEQDRKSEKIDISETDGNEMDENTLYDRAVEFAIASGTVSTSSIQRHFRIGYNRAARIMDKMAKEGLVGPSDVAGKPRQVLVGQQEV